MCHVLVIEDEWIVAEYEADLAMEAGATSYSIVHNEADAILSAHAQKPDLILADVALAQGTGPVAVDVIRSQLGPIPTIFITAIPDDCEPCDHASAILVKPFLGRRLIAEVRRAALV